MSINYTTEKKIMTRNTIKKNYDTKHNRLPLFGLLTFEVGCVIYTVYKSVEKRRRPNYLGFY